MARTPVDPADPIFGPFQERMRRELLKSIVGRIIFCPRTGEVLDVRTCVVFVDLDGDPTYAMSQGGWEEVFASSADPQGLIRGLALRGVCLDRSSVKGAAK